MTTNDNQPTANSLPITDAALGELERLARAAIDAEARLDPVSTHHVRQFDLFGLRWERDETLRKLAAAANPSAVLALVERVRRTDEAVADAVEHFSERVEKVVAERTQGGNEYLALIRADLASANERIRLLEGAIPAVDARLTALEAVATALASGEVATALAYALHDLTCPQQDQYTTTVPRLRAAIAALRAHDGGEGEVGR